jgi:hypothetical protein
MKLEVASDGGNYQTKRERASARARANTKESDGRGFSATRLGPPRLKCSAVIGSRASTAEKRSSYD